MYKKVGIFLTIVFITLISFAYAQKGFTAITGTISNISPVYEIFRDVNTPEEVHISLKEYPNKIFNINRELARQNGLAYPDHKQATEKYRIIGWKVKLTYDPKEQSWMTDGRGGNRTPLYDVKSFEKLN